MRDWNATCGLTNLPIAHDEVVYGVLITGQQGLIGDVKPGEGWWSGFTSSLFYPRTAPILGTYDGYGGLHLAVRHQTLNYDIILAQFKEDLVNDTLKTKNLLPLLSAVVNNEVTIYNHQKDEVPVGLWLVKYSAYESLLTQTKEFNPIFVPGITHKARNLLDNLILLEEAPDDLKPGYGDRLADIIVLSSYLAYSGALSRSLEFYVEYLVKEINSGKLSTQSGEVRLLLEDLMNLAIITETLHNARTSFMPQAGLGSHCTETWAQTAIAKATLAETDA